MKWIIAGLMVALPFAGGSVAHAQDPKDTPWSVEFAIGWDNSISGNINSSGIGTLNDQAVVITKNSYDDVYGTGLHIRFGGGYMIDEDTEVRATFTFQSLDADLTEMGDIGTSRLYGQYHDYQSFGLDVGFRRYVDVKPGAPRLRRRHDRARRSSTRPTSSSSRRARTSPATPPTSTTRRRRSRSAATAACCSR